MGGGWSSCNVFAFMTSVLLIFVSSFMRVTLEDTDAEQVMGGIPHLPTMLKK